MNNDKEESTLSKMNKENENSNNQNDLPDLNEVITFLHDSLIYKMINFHR